MNKSRMALCVTVVFVVVSMLFLPFVLEAQGTPTTITIFTQGNYASNLNMAANQTSTTPDKSAVGNVFIASNTAYLSYINFRLWKSAGILTGSYLQIAIEGASGSISSHTATPNGTVLTTGAAVATTGLNAGADEWITFTFNQSFQMVKGETYAAYIYNLPILYAGAVGTGYVICNYHGAAVTNCTAISYANSAWSNGTLAGSYGMIVVGSSESSVIPTASPGALPTGGSYDTRDTDEVINTLSGYLVPLLTFLVPALLMGYLTHWAKWPIMIGLAIGSGLTYLFLGTAYVWLVFVVIIGIIGMAYQSTKGGGEIR